jgi:hypothetical protein
MHAPGSRTTERRMCVSRNVSLSLSLSRARALSLALSVYVVCVCVAQRLSRALSRSLALFLFVCACVCAHVPVSLCAPSLNEGRCVVRFKAWLTWCGPGPTHAAAPCACR